MLHLIVFWIVIDQLIKLSIVSFFAIGDWVTPIPGMHVTLALNTGVAFGLFSTSHGFGYYLLNTIIILFNAILIEMMGTASDMPLTYRYGIACIIMGGLSNLVDRFIYGAVIDYLTLSVAWLRWPTIFNLADIMICLGCFLLLLANQKHAPKRQQSVEDQVAHEPVI